MKKGQTVRYVDEKGEARPAEIVEVQPRVGKSNYKILTLTFKVDGKETVIEDVVHHSDAEKGQAFWLLKGEKVPEKSAGGDSPPPVDTVACPEPPAGAPASENDRPVTAAERRKAT
jgi:hypothetical protein